MTKNFKRSEFECKCGCGADDISMDLVCRLQEVRDILGEPMKVTSGVRCESHNVRVGGIARTLDKIGSSHLTGNGTAADIACGGSSYRQRLLKSALQVFDRAGVGPDFLHLDVDPNKTAGVVWLYS